MCNYVVGPNYSLLVDCPMAYEAVFLVTFSKNYNWLVDQCHVFIGCRFVSRAAGFCDDRQWERLQSRYSDYTKDTFDMALPTPVGHLTFIRWFISLSFTRALVNYNEG